MKRISSTSLALELVTAVLLALIVSNAATFALFASQRAHDVRFVRLDMAEARLSTLAELLPQVPAAQREKYLFVASGRGSRIDFGAAPLVPDGEPRDRALEARFAAALAALQPSEVRVVFREGEFRPASPFSGGHRKPGAPTVRVTPDGHPVPAGRFAVSAKLPEGQWLNAQFSVRRPDAAFGALLYSTAFTALALVAVALWITFRFAGPLRRLAEASSQLRPGEPVPQIEEKGPFALRHVIRSFNAMSQRLMSTLDGQRTMLAAIAHDLRTPITSLRLRLELLEDADLKERMSDSLDELQSVTEAAVDALKAEGAGETSRQVDLSSLAESICDDLSQLGQRAEFVAGPTITCLCRPQEIRRAIRNLVENAVRYGGRAGVRVTRAGDSARVIVEDEGPGIPDKDLELVFEPFRRLEGSRSRETGGHGLGLTIARSIARNHGGDIVLENRRAGGLRATLSIPLD